VAEKAKVVLVFPLATTADAGTGSSPELVDTRLTVVGNPGPLRVMVQFPPEPEVTLVGLQVSEVRLGFASNETVVV
jgi:hypothetical protein